MKGYNWCIPEGNTIYNALDRTELEDFVDFCDNITEIEDGLYEIDIIFTIEKEVHDDYIELTYIKDYEYFVLSGDSYNGKNHLNFTELIEYYNIDSPKYIYVKATLIPEENEEKHPPIIEGKIYSLDFKHKDNHWFVDSPPFKDAELSYFATIWDLFAVIAADNQPFTLDVICTKKREAHEGWIELYENSGFTYHLDVNGVTGYKSENHVFLSSQVIDAIGFYPKYIYIKKQPKTSIKSKEILHKLLKIFRK